MTGIITVLDTRPNSGDFSDALKRCGLSAIHVPMIRIAEPESWTALDQELDHINEWNGILFTSSNAVNSFLRRLKDRFAALSSLPPIHVIGRKTAVALQGTGIQPATISEGAYGSAMATTLPEVTGKRFLQPCSDIARDELSDGIHRRGGMVQQVVVYRVLGPDPTVVATLRALHEKKGYDWVAFFSPSAVRHFNAALPEFRTDPKRVASIGKTTAEALRTLKLPVDVVSPSQNAEELAETILRASRQL